MFIGLRDVHTTHARNVVSGGVGTYTGGRVLFGVSWNAIKIWGAPYIFFAVYPTIAIVIIVPWAALDEGTEAAAFQNNGFHHAVSIAQTTLFISLNRLLKVFVGHRLRGFLILKVYHFPGLILFQS